MGYAGAAVAGPAPFGADVDDDAAVAGRDHVLEHFAGGQHAAGEVHPDDLVPFVELEIPHVGGGAADAGVVDEDVDAAEGVDGLLHGVDDVLLFEDVHGDGESLAPHGFELLDGRVQVLLVTGGQADDGPFFHEALGDGLADARAAAGDEGHLVFQSVVSHGLSPSVLLACW